MPSIHGSPAQALLNLRGWLTFPAVIDAETREMEWPARLGEDGRGAALARRGCPDHDPRRGQVPQPDEEVEELCGRGAAVIGRCLDLRGELARVRWPSRHRRPANRRPE